MIFRATKYIELVSGFLPDVKCPYFNGPNILSNGPNFECVHCSTPQDVVLMEIHDMTRHFVS